MHTDEKPPSTKPPLKLALSRRNAARALDRSEGYLRLREKHGDGPCFVRCGRAVLYPLDGPNGLRNWLNSNADNCGPSAA